MTPYLTYNEYYAACKTVEKMRNNRLLSARDRKEMQEMIERILLTDKANEL
jgi:uncharacterized protein HemY